MNEEWNDISREHCMVKMYNIILLVIASIPNTSTLCGTVYWKRNRADRSWEQYRPSYHQKWIHVLVSRKQRRIINPYWLWLGKREFKIIAYNVHKFRVKQIFVTRESVRAEISSNNTDKHITQWRKQYLSCLTSAESDFHLQLGQKHHYRYLAKRWVRCLSTLLILLWVG